MIPLPEPTYFTWTDYESKVHHEPYYTAAQLREYADMLQAASNYIDTLGGDSKDYRAAIAKAGGAK